MGQAVVVANADDVLAYALATVSDPALAPVSLWRSDPIGTSEHLLALWGSASDDIYAVGTNGAIIHNDGNVWTRLGR